MIKKFDPQKFDRMHDSWLEPEDDMEDCSLTDENDEMSIASLHKQQQRDYEDFLAETYRQRKECEE